MAQLSDDCFAFGGPMMSVDEAVAIIATRVSAVPDVETVPLAAAVHKFRRRRLCGTQPRSSAREGAGVSGCGARSGRRVDANADRAGPGDTDFYRRADAARRRHGVHAGRRAPP